MPDDTLTPAYDRAACLTFILDEMEKYITSPAELLQQLGLMESEDNTTAILPLLFDARVLHARCLYEFFHNTRTLSKEGNKVYNGINILCGDYGYASATDKRKFYRLKTELDEQAVHLTFVRDTNIDKTRILQELDDFLLPDIKGFLMFIQDRAEYGGYRRRIDAILSKTGIK